MSYIVSTSILGIQTFVTRFDPSDAVPVALDLKSIWNLLQVVRATSEASGSAPSRPGCTPWVGRGDV